MDVLLLKLPGGVYAVPRGDIVDVRACPPLFRPPLTPKEMAGVISLEGATCVVADLSASLGSSPVAGRENLSLLVVDRESELPGFVLAEKPLTLALSESPCHELPAPLRTEVCSSWVAHGGCLAPVLDLHALQRRLLSGEHACVLQEHLEFPEVEAALAVELWQVTLHGKPFAVAAPSLRCISGEPLLAALFSLPDYIPALLLDGDEVIPCCDLAGLLLDAPIDSTTLCVADFAGASIAFWVDEGALPLPLSGEARSLQEFVARKGVEQAIVDGQEIFPLLDILQLCATGRAWHQAGSTSELSVVAGGEPWEAVVEVSINATRYALPRQFVSRETAVGAITPLPASPAIIRGLSLFDDELLPVLDFTPYFGRRAEITATSRLLLVEDRDFRALLLVDEVLQARHLHRDAHRQLPFQLKETLVCGCYVDEKDVVLVLDPLAMASSFREEVVRDFRRHLVASGLVDGGRAEGQGDWWEILGEDVVPDELAAPSEEEEAASGEPELAAEAAAEEVEATPLETPSASEAAADLLAEHPVAAEPGAPEALAGVDDTQPVADETVVMAAEPSTEDLGASELPALEDALGAMAPEVPLDEQLPPAQEEDVAAPSPTADAVAPALDLTDAPEEAAPGAPDATVAANEISHDASAEPLHSDAESSAPEPQQDQEVVHAVTPPRPIESSTEVDEERPVEDHPFSGAAPESEAAGEAAADEDASVEPDDSEPGAEEVEELPAEPVESVLERSDAAAFMDADDAAAGDAEELVAEAFNIAEDVLPGDASVAQEPEASADEESTAGAAHGVVRPHAAREATAAAAPHVGTSPDEPVHERRFGRRMAFLLVLLLLVVCAWWLLSQSGWSPQPAEQAQTGTAEPVRTLVAETFALPPAAGVIAQAAEPRIPQAASDASAGGLKGEQITIVIPAELLKPAYKHQDLQIVIRWGDTLWEIAERYTGDPWNYRRIARENHIQNPDLIFPRQKLNIRTAK